MPPAHWLVKSEPSAYSWDQLVDDRRTFWDGVRNYEARNNLRAMKVGDLALYYHSVEGLEIVGVVRVVREAYPDPTSDEDAWVAVDVEPLQRLARPVTLATVKAEPRLARMQLITRGRISVVPVAPEEFACVLALADTELRPGAVAEKLPPRSAAPREPRAREAAGKQAAGKKRAAGASEKAAGASKKAAGAKRTAPGEKKQAARRSPAKQPRAQRRGRAR